MKNDIHLVLLFALLLIVGVRGDCTLASSPGEDGYCNSPLETECTLITDNFGLPSDCNLPNSKTPFTNVVATNVDTWSEIGEFFGNSYVTLSNLIYEAKYEFTTCIPGNGGEIDCSCTALNFDTALIIRNSAGNILAYNNKCECCGTNKCFGSKIEYEHQTNDNEITISVLANPEITTTKQTCLRIFPVPVTLYQRTTQNRCKVVVEPLPITAPFVLDKILGTFSLNDVINTLFDIAQPASPVDTCQDIVIEPDTLDCSDVGVITTITGYRGSVGTPLAIGSTLVTAVDAEAPSAVCVNEVVFLSDLTLPSWATICTPAQFTEISTIYKCNASSKFIYPVSPTITDNCQDNTFYTYQINAGNWIAPGDSISVDYFVSDRFNNITQRCEVQFNGFYLNNVTNFDEYNYARNHSFTLYSHTPTLSSDEYTFVLYLSSDRPNFLPYNVEEGIYVELTRDNLIDSKIKLSEETVALDINPKTIEFKNVQLPAVPNRYFSLTVALIDDSDVIAVSMATPSIFIY